MTGSWPTGISNTVSGGVQFGPVVQGKDIQLSFPLPPEPPAALAPLPGPVAGFTGRGSELEALTELMDPSRAAGPVVVSAVAGLAGVGKTALVVEAAHAVLERGWFRGVLFIDLHGYDEVAVQPGQALDILLRALGFARTISRLRRRSGPGCTGRCSLRSAIPYW
jgi:AAA ATPase domain